MSIDAIVPPRSNSDFTDRAGAEKLKAAIESYWLGRGYEVQVVLVPGAFTPALRAARFDVRSNLVNGMPRRCCAQSGERCADAA